MTRRAALLVLLALLALLALLVAGGLRWAAVDAPGVVRWTQVQHAAQPLADQDRPPENGWREVTLPLRVRGDPAADSLQRRVWWYRIALDPHTGAQALYVPRITGSAVRVLTRAPSAPWDVLWDGSLQHDVQWNRPIFVLLPAAPQGQEVALSLTHTPDGGHRLTPLRTGPPDALRWRAHLRDLVQQTLPQVVSLAFLVLGLMALLHWLRRPAERGYLLFALTGIVVVLRNLHFSYSSGGNDTQYAVFNWLTHASIAWFMVLTYLFTLRFARHRHPRVEAALMGFAALATLLALAVVLEHVKLLAMHLFNLAVAVTVTAWLLWLARDGNRVLRVVTAALVVTEVAALHDIALATGNVALLESIFWLPISLLVLLLAYLYAAQQHYTQALVTAEQSNALLADKLAEREAELRAGHERLRAVEREQTLLLERQRLMRDMHDGLGSTLMSSLALAERGALQGGDVAGLLRDCMDDLRLVIDSLEPIDHDLVTLLAALRYRIGPRLEGAGLRMQWVVDDLPPLPWLGPPEALQVLRSVQEVLTNVLKHAGATRVRMAVARQGEAVHVDVEDDGRGFDSRRVSEGRGLRHLHERAAQWGGRVEVRSRPGAGTAVRLVLPLSRASA